VTLIAEEDADISSNVHERLVRVASPFFDKALTGPWKESQTRTLHLPADDGLTVGLYVHWLYYRSLPVGYDKPTTEYLGLAKAYVFGDKVLDTDFQNTIMDTIIKGTVIQSDGCGGARTLRVCATASLIAYVYENTVDGASIRKLLIDMWTEHAKPEWMLEGMDIIPPSFAAEIAFRDLSWRSSYSHWNNLDPDAYHINRHISRPTSTAHIVVSTDLPM
jgi:hypothetical protein